MNESPDDKLSIINRAEYDHLLSDLRGQHRLAFYLGRINPYSGKRISTEDEAEIYLEMLAMSIMYQHSVSAAISRADGERAGELAVYREKALQLPSALKKIEQQKKELVQIQARLSSAIARINEQKSQLESVKKEIAHKETQRLRARLLSVLLVIALIFGAYTVPSKLQEKYDAGYAAGKKVSSSYRSSSSASSASTYKTTPYASYSLEMTVYVSNSGHKIHRRSNCSGMKYYTEMSYGEACERGYTHCSKCF